MLKNDILKNGTARIGLYGSAPGGDSFLEKFETLSSTNCMDSL